MRRIACLALALIAASATPCAAQAVIAYETVTTVEEEVVMLDPGSERFVASHAVEVPHGIAQFGPFRVLDGSHAALVDVTDERSPAAFARMLAAWPGLTTLEMIECPGTEDDKANLRLGRMIHARGMATHVPAGGSVRSGAVELFLAGGRRIADRGAEFAVHAWADNEGREATDYAADAPENQAYLTYYREMGMTAIEARAFYDMTNSVPNARAKWMNAAQMALWVRLDDPAPGGSGSLDSARVVR